MHFNCTQNNEKCTKQKLQQTCARQKICQMDTKMNLSVSKHDIKLKKLYPFIFIQIRPPRTSLIHRFGRFLLPPIKNSWSVQIRPYAGRLKFMSVVLVKELDRTKIWLEVNSHFSKYLLFLKKVGGLLSNCSSMRFSWTKTIWQFAKILWFSD